MSLNLDSYQDAMNAETDMPPKELDIVERLGLQITCFQDEYSGSDDNLWEREILLLSDAMAEIVDLRLEHAAVLAQSQALARMVMADKVSNDRAMRDINEALNMGDGSYRP